MKKLITLTTLIFTAMFSSTSFADWTEVSTSVTGDIFYVDFERNRRHEGYVYFWNLIDYLKPTKFGHLSTKIYEQGDCNLFRLKSLSYIQYQQSMGLGLQDSECDYTPENPEWVYPPPESRTEIILKRVCEYIN